MASRALWTGATRPWRLGTDPAPTRLDRVLVVLIPATAVVLSRAVLTWFAAPAHLVLVLAHPVDHLFHALADATRRDILRPLPHEVGQHLAGAGGHDGAGRHREDEVLALNR